MDDTRRPPHWQVLHRLRRHRPVRPDRLVQVWQEFLAAHDGDLEAALGAVVLAQLDLLIEAERRRSA